MKTTLQRVGSFDAVSARGHHITINVDVPTTVRTTMTGTTTSVGNKIWTMRDHRDVDRIGPGEFRVLATDEVYRSDDPLAM